jgi:hypothetical protein
MFNHGNRTYGCDSKVNSSVARHPLVHFLADMEGLSGRFQVQEDVQIGKVIAQAAVSTFLTNVVGVQASAVIRSGLHQITVVIRRQA